MGPAKQRFDIVMEVFFEVLVPKAASPKGAPWEAGLYMYVLCACVDVVVVAVVAVVAVVVLVLCEQVEWYKYSYHEAKLWRPRRLTESFSGGKLISFSKGQRTRLKQLLL